MACVADASGKVRIIDPHPDLPGDHKFMLSQFMYTGSKELSMEEAMAYNGPDVLLGEKARNQARKFQIVHEDGRVEESIVRNVKRLMNDRKRPIRSGNGRFTPVSVSRQILRYLRQRSEEQLGLSEGELTQAVVTVPAYFGDAARRATEDAALKAGFQTVKLLPEPVAAAVGLGLHLNKKPRLILVVDLGGGTLDVTLLLIGRRVSKSGFRVLAIGGDAELGGLNWDKEIADLAVTTALEEHDADHALEKVTNLLDTYHSHKIYSEAERAKIRFNDKPDEGSFLYTFSDGQNNLDYKIKRSEYEEISNKLARDVAFICDSLLKDVQPEDRKLIASSRLPWYRFRAPEMPRVEWEDVDGVYLVGGGGWIREVRRVLEDRCGALQKYDQDPQHCVGFGAARCAALLDKTPDLFRRIRQRCPHTYGIFGYSGSLKRPKFHPLIYRNSVLPFEHDEPRRFDVKNRGKYFLVNVVEERVPGRDAREALEALASDDDVQSNQLVQIEGDGPEMWLDVRKRREYRVVAQPRLDSIGTDPPRPGEEVKFKIRYPEDSSLRFWASFRGSSRWFNINEDGGAEDATENDAK